jgi:hypothetical protein
MSGVRTPSDVVRRAARRMASSRRHSYIPAAMRSPVTRVDDALRKKIFGTPLAAGTNDHEQEFEHVERSVWRTTDAFVTPNRYRARAENRSRSTRTRARVVVVSRASHTVRACARCRAVSQKSTMGSLVPQPSVGFAHASRPGRADRHSDSLCKHQTDDATSWWQPSKTSSIAQADSSKVARVQRSRRDHSSIDSGCSFAARRSFCSS